MDTIISFPHVAPLLPPSQHMTLNLELATLDILSMDNDKPVLIAEQQFTDNELSVLYALLASYPNYCPYHVAIAYLEHGITEQALGEIEAVKARLQAVHGTSEWDKAMKDTRGLVSRIRGKLREMSIHVATFLGTGYLLMPLPDSMTK